ncbi:MAG: hypothetical protein JWM95_5289 [Gemmatimonadetes bacterium]|nr:hypothetical protein [Gemmatimonadota bacterium]
MCADDALVELDLTDVTSAGYYTYDDPVVADAHAALTAAFPANAPTIVLTEGSVDRRALKGALEHLHPHLADLYAFMDFEGMSVPRGAGYLAATVKAFAGAGVANRIIALFDADTGARGALRALAGLRLPPNIQVLTYPPTTLGQSYPTVGPSGAHDVNVNGTAGSVELYFGEDVLRRADGTLTPVQWGGFDPEVGAYQGELQDKAALQSRFWRKLATAGSESADVGAFDWSGMRAILTLLHTAFSCGS